MALTSTNTIPGVISVLDHVRHRLYGDRDMEWVPVVGGSVNSVWRTRSPGTGPVILRIGPSAETVRRGPSWLRADGLACEQVVLDRLRSTLQVVPVPIAAGFRAGTPPWVVQEMIPGTPFSAVRGQMAAENRASIWCQIGDVVRQVRDVPVPWFGTPTGSHRFARWSSMVLADVEGLLEDARRFELPIEPFQVLHRMVTSSKDVLDQVSRPQLVHSDLDPRHIFVVEQADGWEISGIIDWEYARYADPMSESIVVEMVSRPEDDPDREALLEGLGIGQEELGESGFWQRQEIYRRIAAGWALTDAERLLRRRAMDE